MQQVDTRYNPMGTTTVKLEMYKRTFVAFSQVDAGPSENALSSKSYHLSNQVGLFLPIRCAIVSPGVFLELAAR